MKKRHKEAQEDFKHLSGLLFRACLPCLSLVVLYWEAISFPVAIKTNLGARFRRTTRHGEQEEALCSACLLTVPACGMALQTTSATARQGIQALPPSGSVCLPGRRAAQGRVVPAPPAWTFLSENSSNSEHGRPNKQLLQAGGRQLPVRAWVQAATRLKGWRHAPGASLIMP